MEKRPLTLPHQLLSNMLATNRLAYAHFDAQLTLVSTSHNLHQVLGSPSTSPHAPLVELCPEFIGVESILTDLLVGKQQPFVLPQVQRQLPDGTRRYLSLTVMPGDEAAGLLMVEDVTREAQYEQQVVQERNNLRLLRAQLEAANGQLQQLNQFKNMILAMAAHDMRTPLFVIQGYLQMLLLDAAPLLSTEQLEFITTPLAQIRWLDFLISDLLALDKIERGRLEIQPDEVDLAALLRDMGALFEEIYLDRQIELRLVLTEAQTAVWGEADRLRQILFNLLGNAFKYTTDGGQVIVALWVEAKTAVLQISNSGQAITDTEIDHLFQPYYRTDSARHSSIKGVGLGLFITKTLIEAHGGSIHVRGIPDVGTQFTVHLPLPPL